MYCKRLILISLFILPLVSSSLGQVNNMLNYSFEQHTGCSGIGNCSWTNVNNWYEPSDGGVVWFSFPCYGSGGDAGVPLSWYGYQYARTGQSYGAFLAGDTVGEADYLTGTLSDSLKPNIHYCVTFYVSLADSFWWGMSKIGAYFTNDSLCLANTYNVISVTPQIENPASNFITNKIDWVPISGEFQAKGGEKFITIGGFNPSLVSDFDSVGDGGIMQGENALFQSAYFIDDVYVVALTIANAGKADTICNGGGDSTFIGMNTLTTGVSYSWQPTIGLSNPHAPQTMASPTVTTTYTLTVTNDSIHGCNCADSVTKDSVRVTVNTCAGISELRNKNNGVSIYPNPSDGHFTLSMNNVTSKPEIEIYNVLGGNIYTMKVNSGNTRINLEGQPNGVYLYRVMKQTGEFVGSGKVLIQKK